MARRLLLVISAAVLVVLTVSASANAEPAHHRPGGRECVTDDPVRGLICVDGEYRRQV